MITKSDPSVSLPTEPIPHFLHFSFPLHPFNRVLLPKPKPEPIKNFRSSLTSSIPSPFQKLLLLYLFLLLLLQVCDFFLSYALLPLKFPLFPHFAPASNSVFSLSCFTFFVCECLISFLKSSPFYWFLN